VVGKYEYDGRGRRTVSHIDSAAPGEPDGTLDDFRHFFYNNGWQILETRMADAADASADTVQPEYQYAWSMRYIDAPVLRDENTDTDDDCIDGSDQRLYYATDANMNVTALVNTSGTVAERYLYDPYGNVTTMDENWTVDTTPDYDNSILYCGYYYDKETALYHVRNRYLHPTLGRWTSRDPVGQACLHCVPDEEMIAFLEDLRGTVYLRMYGGEAKRIIREIYESLRVVDGGFVVNDADFNSRVESSGKLCKVVGRCGRVYGFIAPESVD